MKRKILCHILIASILLSSLVCVISKTLLLFGAANHQQAVFKEHAMVDPTTRNTQDVPRHFDSTQGTKSERILTVEYKEALRTRIGSTPPRCEHRCGQCIPCIPIQIPTNKDLLGVHYASYKPEGWKCKCGTSYFNP